MKKRTFIFFVIVGIALTSYSQNKFYDLTGWGFGILKKVSPNGRYVIGNATNVGDYIWDITNQKIQVVSSNSSTNLLGVNDSAHVSGTFLDSTMMVYNGKATVPIVSAGVFKNNKWYSLGGGQRSLASMGTRIDMGAIGNGISNDGKVVVGMSYNKSNSARVVPFRWTLDANNNVIDTVTYNYVVGEQGSRFWDIANDGVRGCGYVVLPNTTGLRRPIVFKNPTEYKVINPDRSGDAYDISPNGKYVALSTGGYAALYDVDKDTLIYCGGVKSTYPSAVSNDGIVVGYRTVTIAIGESRKGFVWSPAIGYIELADFIKTYTPDITLPQEMSFTDTLSYDVPLSISGDGLTFGGWSGYTSQLRYGWLLKMAQPINVPERPYKITASTDLAKRNSVNLTWKIKTDLQYTLKGFKIYCDTSLVATINNPSQLNYTDSVAPAGYLKYYVKAVYSNTESPMSDFVNATVIDSYQIPFSENFESATLVKNYWTNTTTTSSNYWGQYSTSGVGRSVCIFFNAKAAAAQYQNYIQSKPFDATNLTSVYLSYIQKVQASVITGLTDTLYIEVGDINGANWKIAKSYLTILMNQVYTPERLDISSLAAGKVFRVRFRMSGKDRKSFYYYLDNVAVTSIKPEAPKDIKISKLGNFQQVTWKDPAGSYGLTYSSTRPTQPIGDEGTPFIAANKFDSTQLKIYAGKYLTSVSAFIYQSLKQEAGITPTKLKVVVFNATTKIVEQDVTSFIPNSWNTFKLKTPVAIPETGYLLFGLKVVKHDPGEMPLMIDNSAAVEGKGNLFSEDEGASWQTLSAFNLVRNWSIIGNVRSEQAEVERDGDVLGYEVYRNDLKINKDFIFAQQYTDSLDLTTANYDVRAIFSTKGVSDKSETVVFTLSAMSQIEDVNLIEMPSVVKSGFIIKSEINFEQFNIFDTSGKLVLSGRYSSENYIDVSHLHNGIYYLTVFNKNTRVNTKFIKVN